MSVSTPQPTPGPHCTGAPLPADGSLTDAAGHYCVALCGYAVRYPAGHWETHGRPAIDHHYREHHPDWWAEIQHIDRMSRD